MHLPAKTRAEIVQKQYGKRVSHYDDDEQGFTCSCGVHVSLQNGNWLLNVENHFKSPLCRRRRTSMITQFFKPTKQYARPEPVIYCLGLWQSTIVIDGKQCKLQFLAEYADYKQYYVCTKSFTVIEANGEEIQVKRSIHSVDCKGHALDIQDRLRPSRNCENCANLAYETDFKRILLEAQNPNRFKTSCRLPDKYYSWKHLQVSSGWCTHTHPTSNTFSFIS